MSKKPSWPLWILVLSTAVVGAVNLFTRFSNPAMTETQLFLSFWHYYAAAITVFVVAAIIVIWQGVK